MYLPQYHGHIPLVPPVSKSRETKIPFLNLRDGGQSTCHMGWTGVCPHHHFGMIGDPFEWSQLETNLVEKLYSQRPISGGCYGKVLIGAPWGEVWHRFIITGIDAEAVAIPVIRKEWSTFIITIMSSIACQRGPASWIVIALIIEWDTGNATSGDNGMNIREFLWKLQKFCSLVWA
jgi:hypothetical protein